MNLFVNYRCIFKMVMDSHLHMCFENQPYVNRSSVDLLVMNLNCDDKCMYDEGLHVFYSRK